MSFRKTLMRMLLAIGTLTSVHTAFAHVIDCTPGYSDSRCVTPIIASPIPAPRCSTAAGWTTTSAAIWKGSHWSQPACNYQSPPTCSSGYTQTGSPVWNGSSWSAPTCQRTVTPPTTTAEEEQACQAALATLDPWGLPDSGFMHWTSALQAGQSLFGSLGGPYYGQGMTQYTKYADNPYCGFATIRSSGTPGSPSDNDLWYGIDSSGGLGYCWITPGSTVVSGVLYELENPNTCGGGPN
ncbi:hypothetical protein AWB78_07372 [Caballeronia calidae]|uniref:Uncharacterized protein n=1 Tax=Caballeronia calidae TaxID=1777139 RepID=A0A158EEE9_9BURK|nr:hypothetical protein AWB78_07372 [Caballeronia calidae]